MKLVLDEWIIREVIDTLYMALTTFHGITGLDSPQEVAKKSANETAITRRISKAIDIIQQGQQEVDLVAELEHHLATTPKEQLEKEWKELEPWGNIGPTVQEFLYGKQPEPEVDLEKEIEEQINIYYNKCEEKLNQMSDDDTDIGFLTLNNFARHFYELGLNARNEEQYDTK